MTLWFCTVCPAFQTLQLKSWMHHVRMVHSTTPNFKVRCPVNNCPSEYTIYHSLYKHISKHHKLEYEDRGVANIINAEEVANDDQVEINNEINYSDNDTDVEISDSESNVENTNDDNDDGINDIANEMDQEEVKL